MRVGKDPNDHSGEPLRMHGRGENDKEEGEQGGLGPHGRSECDGKL